MGYTHVLNLVGRGVRRPLDSLRKAVCSKRGGIIRTGRPKTAREVMEQAGSHYKQSGCHPVWRRRLRLRPTRTGLIQVSLNKS